MPSAHPKVLCPAQPGRPETAGVNGPPRTATAINDAGQVVLGVLLSAGYPTDPAPTFILRNFTSVLLIPNKSQ